MRTMKELLQLILGNEKLFETGLCRWAVILRLRGLITFEEYLRIINHIFLNKPDHVITALSTYWWDSGLKELRITWLKEQIKLLDNDHK